MFKKGFILFLCFSLGLLSPCLAQNYSVDDIDTTNMQAEPVSNEENGVLPTENVADSASNEETYEDEEEGIEKSNWKREIDSEAWQRILKDKEFDYEKKPKKRVSNVNSNPAFDLSKLFNAGFFKALMYVLIGLLILTILYYILKDSDFSYFKAKRKEKEALPEADWENVQEFTEWEKAMHEATSKQDYRLGTRILYLELLQKMSQRNLIQYHLKYTNWDYANQLLQSNHYDSFTKLTKYFEYIWYGTIRIDTTQFEKLRQEFMAFKQLIN